MVLSKRIPRYLLTIAAVVLSVACMAMAVSEEGVGGGVVMDEALSAPQHAHLVDSIRGPSVAATKGDALAKEYEHDDLGEDVGARRGCFLSTSGSFTVSSGGGGSRAGTAGGGEF